MNLERGFRMLRNRMAPDHLDAVLINSYIGPLLGNARVVRYAAQHHGEILWEFQKLSGADRGMNCS